jgi:hypothetical protein
MRARISSSYRSGRAPKGMSMNERLGHLEVHGVLAGAYAGHVPKLEFTLTHVSRTDTWDSALCGRVKQGNLADERMAGPPTCQRCRAIWNQALATTR